MREDEQTREPEAARRDVDAPGDIGGVDARLDDPQRHRTERGGEQGDRCEPHDRIRIRSHPRGVSEPADRTGGWLTQPDVPGDDFTATPEADEIGSALSLLHGFGRGGL